MTSPIENIYNIDSNKNAFRSINNVNNSHQIRESLFQSMLKSTCVQQCFVEDTQLFNISTQSTLPGSIDYNNTKIEPSSITTNLSQASIYEKNKTPTSSVNEFVRTLWPYAQYAAKSLGLDPRVLIAQAAHETGWGKLIISCLNGTSSNNLFNIKSTDNNSKESINIKTTEYFNNKRVKISAPFKTYQSIEHSFNDYVSLIKNTPRYKLAIDHVNDPKLYMEALQNAGYATDPQYANKILSIYNSSSLQDAVNNVFS